MIGGYSYPRALLIGLALATLAAVLLAGATSSAAFGAYNPSWEGTSEFRALATAEHDEAVVVRGPERFEAAEPNQTVGVLVAPGDYTSDERSRFRAFVREGGTLVVAADSARANRVLRAVGATARIDGRLVRDEHRYYRGPALPVATNVSDAPLTSGVDALTLNYGTTLRPGNATVLVRTSPYAYLDTNLNGTLDAGESLGRRPVVTTERVGDGRVVAISDPSVFINAMLERPGNRQFANNLLADADTVLLSYGSSLPPLVAALAVIRRTPLLQGLLGFAALGVVTLWTARPGLIAQFRGSIGRLGDREESAVTSRGDPSLSESELEAALRRRHPDWDADRVARVMTAIKTRRGQGEDDG